MKHSKRIILCILDGWGISPKKKNNAIYLAHTPTIDYLSANYPYSLIKTSGQSVGLPDLHMGNSEVGHMTMGAGRIISQDLIRINQFLSNSENISKNYGVKKLIKNTGQKSCHIISMISDGGIHSHIRHIIKMAKFLIQNGVKVKVHAFTDGRDATPKSAIQYVKTLQENKIEIVSICGRYFAMDRDLRWERTKLAYEAITAQKGLQYSSLIEYIGRSYINGITDEFIKPAFKKTYYGIEEGDSFLFFNFRADRIKQIVSPFLLKNFSVFNKKNYKFSFLGSVVQYSEKFDHLHALIPKQKIYNDLGTLLSKQGYKQLRISETEKYSHVTHFLNCGREAKMECEDWIMVDSPKVNTYDLQPEMSAYKITDELVRQIKFNKFEFICVNYANADMVGHTGDLNATIKACSVIDQCITKIIKVCKENYVELLITADHGNAEEMFDEHTKQAKTSHSVNDVPLIYFGNRDVKLLNGELSDIAPTILDLYGISKPKEMTGKTLIKYV